MSVEGVLSIEEQRALVYEYLGLPYGGKSRFLEERGVSRHVMDRLRVQVAAGTLEHGLVPRTAVRMSGEDKAVLKKLLAENETLREELERQRRTVEALGKAIELLHPHGATKSSQVDPRDNESGQQPG